LTVPLSSSSGHGRCPSGSGRSASLGTTGLSSRRSPALGEKPRVSLAGGKTDSRPSLTLTAAVVRTPFFDFMGKYAGRSSTGTLIRLVRVS